MARRVEVAGAGTVKIIGPWRAFLLALVTLGVYDVLWYGMRNAELNDFGRGHPRDGRNALKVRSFLAMAAITVGTLLLVPPFVSQWRFYRRIARAQAIVGVEERVNHVVGLLLFVLGFVLLPVEILYAQRHLNRLWERAHSKDVARFG